jgi:hypothetical protein
VADELLELAAAVDPGLVRAGIPAHATVAYPFLPAAEVTTAVLARLGELVAGTGPISLTLDSVFTSAGFVGVAVSELAEVTASIRSAWPRLTPYGGRFGADPPVHVTVAMGATQAETDRIVPAVSARLPRVEVVTELRLVALDETAGWRSLATIPLA